MRYSHIPMQEFSNVGYNKNVTVKIEPGPNLMELVITTKNIDFDQLGYVRLKVGSGTPYEVEGDFFDTLQHYKGETQEENIFIIPFADFSGLTQEGQEMFSLQTLPGENIILEIQVKDRKAGQTEMVPEISGIQVSSESIRLKSGQFYRKYMPKIFEMLIPIGKTGRNTFRDFNSQECHAIRRIFFKSENITDIEINLVDGERARVGVDYLHYQAKRFGHKVPPGYTVFDPAYLNWLFSDMMNVTGKFELVLVTTNAEDIDCIVEGAQLRNEAR